MSLSEKSATSRVHANPVCLTAASVQPPAGASRSALHKGFGGTKQVLSAPSVASVDGRALQDRDAVQPGSEPFDAEAFEHDLAAAGIVDDDSIRPGRGRIVIDLAIVAAPIRRDRAR